MTTPHFETSYKPLFGPARDCEIVDPIIVAGLPRADYPEEWCVLGPDRMIRAGRVKKGALDPKMLEEPGCTVHRNDFGDCPACRDERAVFASRFDAKLRTSGGKEFLRWLVEVHDWWCNDCQGTGWLSEPIPRWRSRLGIVTKADVLAQMSVEALIYETEHWNYVDCEMNGKRYTAQMLMHECAKRLKPPEEELNERCPTCADPVKTIFDHLDVDCKHD